MSGETWTEYAVRWPAGMVALGRTRNVDQARQWVLGTDGIVVGRTVTATDWLPVDTDGAK